jgi:hypothetical protein
MATINIDPSISLGAKPAPTMTLPEMLNFARGMQAFQQAEQVFPEQAEQARIATQTARTGQEQAVFTLSKDQNNALMGIVGGFRNDPRIASGNPDTALSALDEIKAKAVAAGIPRSMVERMAGTATNIAINDPKRLPQYFDNVIQSQAGAGSQLGLQTPELTTQAGAPAAFRRGPGTLTPVPIQGAPQAAPQAVPQAAPRGVTPEDMTAPITPQAAPMAAPQAGLTDPGYPLRFPPRPIGDIRPPAAGEEAAAIAGNTYLNNIQSAQNEVPKALRNVSEVIRGAEELEKKINFQTGKPADVERAVRTFFGDDQYKQLSKDIANAQIALMRSTGGDLSTDAGKALVARATGDETYPPAVLISIARRLNGELTKADMEARGAQRAATLFGNANLPAFQQAWNDNSQDLRVFEAIAITKNIKDPKKQKSALDKILPATAEELGAFQQQYRNIKRLSETGTLR